VQRAEKVEWLLIILAILSLWPWILNPLPWSQQPPVYRIALVAVLGAMVWVARARWRRLRR